jgi:hypothetical protein
MKTGTRIALAVGAGYILGRRKKLRPALTLAAAVAAGRASHNAPNLLKFGSDLLGSSPGLKNLSTLSKPLTAAGKAAATAAVGSGVDALSGRLRDRADSLRRRPSLGRADNDDEQEPKSRKRSTRDDDEDDRDEFDEDDDYEGDEPDDEDEDEEEEEPEAPDRKAPRGRTAPREQATAGSRQRRR